MKNQSESNFIKVTQDIARILNECCNVYDENGWHIRNKCRECEHWSVENHCCCSYSSKQAEALYNAGYRLRDEVAIEIFAKLLKHLMELLKFQELLLECMDSRFAAAKREAYLNVLTFVENYSSFYLGKNEDEA